MSKQFRNKVVIVTGATSGIGKATAELFCEEGASVVLAGRRETQGAAAAESIRNNGGDAIFIRTDVCDADSIAHLVQKTIRQYGRLDYAFNNAGIAGANLLDTTQQALSAWDEVINTNLRGIWLCMKHELLQMKRQGHGAVVNTASMYAQVGSDLGISPYVASKHGVLGLTRAAAVEFGKSGIRINAVAPGATRTEMTSPAIESYPTEFGAMIQRHVPLARVAEPSEIAHAVLWLCSDKASYVTGHALSVDGGWLSL
jgi:NAD(P)-dependent dehydrogenase (short-subunit alcohol dehydrogenase family)